MTTDSAALLVVAISLLAAGLFARPAFAVKLPRHGS